MIPASPLDVDAMLFEMSVAKSQTMQFQNPGRQPSYRQNLTRVTKPSSAGSSPQYPQRRRASSSHRISKYRPELHPQAIQALQQGILNLQDQQPQPSRARPLSWHPSTMAPLGSRPASYLAPNDVSYRYSLNDYLYTCSYQTVAVNGMPTPMTQPDLNVDIPLDPFFNLDDQTSFPSVMEQQQQSIQDFDGSLITGPLLDQAPPLDRNSLYTMSTLSTSEAYPTFSPAASQTETWTDTNGTVSTQTAPPTPDVLPIQKPSDLTDGMKDDNGNDDDDDQAVSDLSPLDRKESHELIGMGLYDDHHQNMRSAGGLLGASFTSSPHVESTGKGLKLEETWEPPEDDGESDGDDDDCDDDDESSESGEGDEDTKEEITQIDRETRGVGLAQSSKPEPVASNLVGEVSVQLQDDMSNRSFFFDAGFDSFVGGETGQSMALLMQGMQQQVLLGGGCR